MTRPAAATIANAVAAVVLAVLGVGAAVFAAVLGPAGLIIVGLLDLFVCARFSLDEEAPSWGVDIFAARLGEHRSPEMRAAVQAVRQQRATKLRFYQGCGVALVTAGVAGVAWQVWW